MGVSPNKTLRKRYSLVGMLYTYAPYCQQNFGGQVALPLLFSSETSGDKAYELARPAAAVP